MSSEKFVPNERLRHVRNLKGWTQAELAEQVGTSFEIVSRWERGISMPSPYFRKRLCAVLGKTADELGLVGGSAEPVTLPSSPLVALASSYVDEEKGIVTHLKISLQNRGITVLSSGQIGKWGGEQPQKTMREVIRAAQMILVILSPEARTSRHVRQTLELASMYERGVYGIWIEGEDWQACLPKGNAAISTPIDARSGDGTMLLGEVIRILEREEPAADIPSVSPSAQPEAEAFTPIQPRNPYKGLQAFQREDRQDFFGREAFIDELTAALKSCLDAEQSSTRGARLLTITGPSGSGKSSLVLAGLLPSLQAGKLPGSETWVYLDPIVPRVHPLESLALALSAHLPDRSLQTLHEDLESDSAHGLHMLAMALVKQRETKVVFFVDQFEELFSPSTTEQERQYFIDLLVTAVTEPCGPTIVILTLRADFSDRPMHYPELYRLLTARQKAVLPMEISDLRAIIERPAALPDVQLTFEADLVGDLLFEAQGQPGSLPLLEFTLTQLFARRRGHTLTLQAYHELGGVKGTLARHAEEIYASLPSEEHRRLAQVLFLRLIQPGMTEQDTTRRRASLAELQLVNPHETIMLEEVTRTFITARLLTASTIAGVAMVEVSHEAVIREWPRLVGWLREAREDIRLQQTLSQDAAAWERQGKSADHLYRGSRLREARAWAARNTPSRSELAFLRAGTLQRRRFHAGVLAVCLLFLSLATVAVQFGLNQPPDPTRVTNLEDNGPGSLRWAVDNAPSGSTITFNERLRGQTITLSSGDLQITRNIRLIGPGEEGLTISSDQNNESVMVFPGVVVTVSNVRFQGTIGEGSNSGITNAGTLTLINSTVSDYYVMSAMDNPQAGGITNAGTLTLINSIVADNHNDGDTGGSGIINAERGMLTLINSTVEGNASGNGDGGAILNAGTLALINSTVARNASKSGNGGGIENAGTLTLTNSTIWGNSSLVDGGGISNEGSAAQTTLTFCTIDNNRAGDRGGGIWNGAGSQHLVARNSIIAGNTAFASPNIAGRLTSKGYNLLQDTAGAVFTANTQHTTDVVLAPHTSLQIDSRLSGRLPQTLALLPGSPATDAIPLDACSLKTAPTDERGVKRPDGHERMCDIGAYEYSD